MKVIPCKYCKGAWVEGDKEGEEGHKSCKIRMFEKDADELIKELVFEKKITYEEWDIMFKKLIRKYFR